MPRIAIDYFEAWRERVFVCECGWSGPGSRLTACAGVALFTLECPRCRDTLAGSAYPTIEEARVAADRGHPEAQRWLGRERDR
ncbi:MAG: hypothetical protein H6724_10330 [Sandaracinus sp.]|nr:hypothetical protein [Sandaracinus sp.]